MNRRAIFLGLLLCVLQAAFAYEEELRFVKGLTEEGFPKLAEKVLSRTLEKYPEAEKEAPELRIRILIASRKFAEAGSSLATCHLSLATQESLWLFLAESATAAGQKPVAETAYENYFKTATEPDDQAVFNYGSLLEEHGDDATAIKLYEKADSRPVKARLAALLVESDPDRALKLAEEVQLGGLDLWFGSAVVTWARVMIGKGEWDETQSVLETQLELLKQLEDSLAAQGQPVSLVSPLASARYWLGVCYDHAGEKAKALTQFYNVYAKYGDSEWGPGAQEKAQALVDEFEAEGKTVKIDLGANQAKMEESAFRTARRLFFERRYADAKPLYIDALNDYPEGPESITALREFCLCAIHLDNEWTARAIASYLAERFADEPKAGDALLAAGKAALDAKKKELAWNMYGLYLDRFPEHPRAPAVLYSLAGLRKQDDYLHRIIENYPDSPYCARALGRLAWNAYETEDYKLAAERFAPYIETETDPQKHTRARFAFAESYRQLAQNRTGVQPVQLSEYWKKSLEVFQCLEKEMADAAAGFGVSAETLTFNRPFWEKSIYYQAVCHKELGETDAAVECCDRFLKKFPRSGIAEQVQFAKAETLIESGRFADALAALEVFGDDTQNKFSESVCYYRGIAQYETGAYEASFQTLEKLLTNWPSSAFTYEAMFVQGRALLAAGRKDDAIRVFGEIMSFASDDLLLHRASLELGRAQTDPADKLASFQRVALLADPMEEKQAPLIAEALFESLPLYLELDRPADLIVDADRLLSDFPTFGKTDEINSFKTRAQAVLASIKEGITDEHE